MSSPIGFGLPPSAGQPALVFTPSVGEVPTNDPAGQPLALTAERTRSLRKQPNYSGETPQRVFLLGDSLTMRRFRVITGGTSTLQNRETDVEIALGSGSALPVVGSYVRIINQADEALNIDVPVVGSGTNSCIVRFPFSVSNRITATVAGALYGIQNDTGWWNYAEGELAAIGRPAQVLVNAATGGDNLEQMRARIATEITPYAQAGDIVVVMGGVNGANNGDTALSSADPQELVSELRLLIDTLLAEDYIVCISTITQAQASGYWSDPATALANTRIGNGYIRGRGLSDANVHVFDSHAALGGGDYASGDVEASGVHFLSSGAEKVGQRFVDDCGHLFSKRSFRRVLSIYDEYVDSGSWNLVTNPEFVGATGSTKPTDWTVTSAGGGTKTYTLVDRADGIGTDLQIQHTHTAATGTQLTQDITDRLMAGWLLAFGIEYESNTPAEGHYWRFSLEFIVDGVTYAYVIGNNQYSYAQGGRLPPAGVRRFFENYGYRNRNGREGILVPEGFTTARLNLRWQLGASGSLDFTVGRPQVYRIA